MLIAKITENGIEVADHTVLLPDTSFSFGGPTPSQLEELGYFQVTVWKPYDSIKEKLVPAPAYVEDNQVFTVAVEPKTEEDLANDVIAVNIVNKEARAQAYREVSDPLFFKAQRGEATMDEWLAKVAEIREQFPLTTEEEETDV